MPRWTVIDPAGHTHSVEFDPEPPKSGYWPTGWIGAENLPKELLAAMRSGRTGEVFNYMVIREADRV